MRRRTLPCSASASASSEASTRETKPSAEPEESISESAVQVLTLDDWGEDENAPSTNHMADGESSGRRRPMFVKPAHASPTLDFQRPMTAGSELEDLVLDEMDFSPQGGGRYARGGGSATDPAALPEAFSPRGGGRP